MSQRVLLMCLFALLLASPLHAQPSATATPGENEAAGDEAKGDGEDSAARGPAAAPEPPPARAPEPVPAPPAAPDPVLGRKLFGAGVAAFKRGDFLTALQAFEAAYRADPRPGILFSVAQAHRRQYVIDHDESHLRGAVDQYRRYIEVDPGGSRRGEAAQALVELEPLLPRERGEAPVAVAPPKTQLLVVSVEGAMASLDGAPMRPVPFVQEVASGGHHIRATAPGYLEQAREARAVEGVTVMVDLPLHELPAHLSLNGGGAELWVDERFVTDLPLADPLRLPPGRHFVVVRQTGHVPLGQLVELERGDKQALDVDLSPTGQRVGAIATLGVALAAIATGSVLAVVATVEEGAAQDFLDATSSGNVLQAELDDYRDTIARRNAERTASIALLAGGAGVGIVAAALILFDDPSPPQAPPSESDEPEAGGDLVDLAFQPQLGPSAVGLGLSGRF